MNGIDHIADRLRHLLPAIEQEAVREDALRHLDAGRHQEGRPIDRVEAHDVLADDVQRRRPIALEFLAVVVGKADAGDVIGQRVDPHIHDVLVVAGHADAPVEGGARDRQVLQAAAHEARDFVEPLLRQHVIRPLVELEQFVLISRQAEEVTLLLHPLDRRAGLRRDPHLLLVQMRLAPRRNRPRRAPNTSRRICRDRCRRSSPCGARFPPTSGDGAPRWCG